MGKDTTTNIREGDAILLISRAGLKGTAYIAQRNEDDLRGRYTASFIEEAKHCYTREKEIADDLPFLRDLPHIAVEKGGVFRALWELIKEYPFGFEVDVLEIPLRHETIELCNYFDINPYELLSGKCMAVISGTPRHTLNTLRDAGYTAAIIGEITAGNDKIIRYKGGSLYLRPSKQDAIEKVGGRKERWN